MPVRQTKCLPDKLGAYQTNRVSARQTGCLPDKLGVYQTNLVPAGRTGFKVETMILIFNYLKGHYLLSDPETLNSHYNTCYVSFPRFLGMVNPNLRSDQRLDVIGGP